MRIGIGYDSHPLVSGRKLVLGGVHVPYDEGLDGWSDADVLTHAICDALLGAAALGDIGRHFPSGNLEYKDIPSLSLLEKVVDKLTVEGWRVVNVDATIVAESPRLSEYIDEMRSKLAEAMRVGKGQVGVKASTSNGLGFVGRGEGMAAYAVALVEGGTDEGI
jgi:2-C-methyl-D-erythritol 2,4-cyclodiphosphate synthase